VLDIGDLQRRDQLGSIVVRYLQRRNEAVDYELRVEQMNKQLLLVNQKFVEHLLQLIVDHVVGPDVLKLEKHFGLKLGL